MKNEDQQLFTFLEFCESEMHLKDVWTKTLVRWLREDGKMTSQQWLAVEKEVIKRKGFYV